MDASRVEMMSDSRESVDSESSPLNVWGETKVLSESKTRAHSFLLTSNNVARSRTSPRKV